jgi:cell division protease FtsH
MGQRRESLVLSEKEKVLTAYHEAGHAVCATVLPNADPVHKVTILPTGMALGVTQTMPEERHAYSKDHLLDRICMTMGGRVAEELVFTQRTTGAANDLEVATRLAKRMVREWGMSDKVGPMAWESQQHVFLGEDLMTSQREYSDDTARMIDEEVAKILHEQEDRARQLLTHHRRGLDLVAEALLEKETIEGSEVSRLVQLGLVPSSNGQDADTDVREAHESTSSA